MCFVYLSLPGCIGPVHNQNMRGNSPEVVGAVEAVSCLVTNTTGKIISLSTQQVHDCMAQTQQFGEVIKYIQKSGLESEADYPNHMVAGQESACRYNAAKVAVKVPKIGGSAQGTEKALREALHVVNFCV